MSEKLPDNYIEDLCPNCSEIVEFTQPELDTFDGHHLEIVCPWCGKLCCFICGYVYTGMTR